MRNKTPDCLGGLIKQAAETFGGGELTVLEDSRSLRRNIEDDEFERASWKRQTARPTCGAAFANRWSHEDRSLDPSPPRELPTSVSRSLVGGLNRSSH